jgi:periplasmic protein TonB
MPTPRAEPQLQPRAEPQQSAPAPRPTVPVEPRREAVPARSAAAAPAAPNAPAAARAGPLTPPTVRTGQRREEEGDSGLDGFAMEIQKRVGKLVNERGERAYPRLARERRLEGTTQVAVEYAANGKLKRIVVAESSGHAVLDQKAVEMVQEVLPPVPGGGGGGPHET